MMKVVLLKEWTKIPNLRGVVDGSMSEVRRTWREEGDKGLVVGESKGGGRGLCPIDLGEGYKSIGEHTRGLVGNSETRHH